MSSVHILMAHVLTCWEDPEKIDNSDAMAFKVLPSKLEILKKRSGWKHTLWKNSTDITNDRKENFYTEQEVLTNSMIFLKYYGLFK